MKLLLLNLILFVSFIDLIAQSNTYNVPDREKKKISNYRTFFDVKDYKIGLSLSKVNASSYFDIDGNTVSTLIDTAYLDEYSRLYTIEFEKLTFDLFSTIKVTNNFLIQVHLPLSSYSLNEKYLEIYDSVNNQILPKVDKANFSYFAADYLESKSLYKLTEGMVDLNLALTFKLPFGTENGVAVNTRDFWSDYAIELLPEINFGLNFEKFNVSMAVLYDYRTEDLKDLLISRLTLGLYSIPDTYIGANFEWANSLISFDNALPFNTRKEPSMENYLKSNVYFGILLSKELGVDFNYSITFFGKNSWNYFGYRLGVFYNL